MNIFADHAPRYAEAGFRCFPTGGPDGKKPLIKNWQKVGRRAAPELADKFPDANLGVLDGDRVTKVDIDDPALIDGAIERFGDTPIKVETPSGGFHLWYRANGELRQTILDGEKIDILGSRGFSNAPPSVNPKRGRAYRFIEGTLADVQYLRPIKADALPGKDYEATPETVSEGRRNKALFGYCMKELADGWEPGLIPGRASVWNESLNEPLPDAEVLKTAASAIKYHAEGKNWIGGNGVVKLPKTEFDAFEGDADAFWLLAVLQFNHGSRRRPFALVATAMREAEVIPGWGHSKYEAKTKRLLDMGKLRLVKQGGGNAGPNLYALSHYPSN